MKLKFEINGLDSASSEAVVSLTLFGDPAAFHRMSEKNIQDLLRTLAFKKCLPWLISNPEYSLNFDSLSGFEHRAHYSGIQGLDGAWAKGEVHYRIRSDFSRFSTTNHRQKERKRDMPKLKASIFSQRPSRGAMENDALFMTDKAFAAKIGFYLNRSVSLHLANKRERCLEMLRQGAVDLVIGSISINDTISEELCRSETYFETGSVFASFSPHLANLFSDSAGGPRIPGLGYAVISNTPEHALLKSLVPPSSQVIGLPNIYVMKKQVRIFEAKHEGEKRLILFLPEAEAAADQGLFIAEYRGKRCWTWQRYVVIVRDRRLAREIDQVIRKADIPSFYANLCGRLERS